MCNTFYLSPVIPANLKHEHFVMYLARSLSIYIVEFCALLLVIASILDCVAIKYSIILHSLLLIVI